MSEQEQQDMEATEPEASTDGHLAPGTDAEAAGGATSAGGLTEEEILEDAREDALDFLEGLLDAMDLDCQVEAEVREDVVAVSVNGADAGILIGRRGQTLDAVQDLLRTVIQRQNQARVRVMLDIEGYRDRRKDAVRAQAQEAARQALEGDEEIELEPMPAFERKAVHDAVAELEGVTSFSEGEEPRRKVVIRPSGST